MTRFLGFLVVTALLSGPASPSRADEKDATPILDKAIAALGGEEKLARAATSTSAGKGTITIRDEEIPVKTRTIVQGMDRHRAETEIEVNGNQVKFVFVLNVDKGWRKFGENVEALDDAGIATEKQRSYLQAAATVLPLKGKGFKVEAAPEEKVAGKPAAVVKGTGPDGKSFTLHFDKESGLPVKLTATVKSLQGEDQVQETIFGDYKEFDGVKRPTRSESTRDGNPFVKLELTEYKVIDKPEAGSFDEPK
jgi:hypothetical protein